MIDKRIFYCWFGHGEMSELNKKCIESWKRICPDYEIVEINEDNFDVNSTPYSKTAYEHKNWSYVSNAARLEFLSKSSGIYLDTDVQLIKPLDELLHYDHGFITEFEPSQPDSGVLGCDCNYFPELYKRAKEGLVPGAILHKEFIKNMYKMYDIHGSQLTTYDDGFTILGEEYFPTRKLDLITPKTIGIHYFEGTWKSGWVNVTDPFYPFQRIIVARGNKLIYSDKDPEIKVWLKSMNKQPKTFEIIGEMNYFFNPKVVKLFCRNFEAERIEYDKTKPTKTTVTPTGMIVTYYA